MRRPLTLLGALVVASVIGSAAPASAQTSFKRCGRVVLCGKVTVPIDRAGAVPGAIGLEVERVRLSRRSTGAIVALSGGPGQPTLPFTEEIAAILRPALRSRDLVVYDQRGTGGSGLLRCPALERAPLLQERDAAAQCAETLGPQRAFYTTRDSVEDLEAVRQATGVERISLFGISYGTKLALAYAMRYPEHVERLVLDSVLEPEGPDPFYRDTFAASARALVELCRGACSKITPDPVADLSQLVSRFAAGPVEGFVNGEDGRRRAVSLTRFDLVLTLLAGDFDPAIRAGVPASVRSALRGDLVPLLRLVRRARAEEGEPVPPRLFSTALFAATICEETELPWARTAPPEARLSQAAERLAALPDSAFALFDRATALDSDLIRLCGRWPSAPQPPALAAGPFPAVPALILEGEEDIRTPIEAAQRLVARLPAGARLLAVPGAGHSVLGSDRSGCAERALSNFFADRAVGECRRGRREYPPDPVAPLSIAELGEAKGARGKRGRTISAVGRTALDVLIEATTDALADPLDSRARGAGLRAGTFRRTRRGLLLRGVVYVPGVRVSGILNDETGNANLKVSGSAAADGTLRLRESSARGRLDGRRVRAVLRKQDAGLARASGLSRPATRAGRAGR